MAEDDKHIADPAEALHVPTVEEARQEALKKMSGEALQGMALKKGKDGKSHIFGLTIPETFRPLIEFAYATALPYIQRSAAETAYKTTHKVLPKLKIGAKGTHITGLVLENVVRWGLVGGKNVVDIIHANSDYSAKRKALFHEFSPVIDATKTNYIKNEVMKVVFDQLHTDMVTDMKMVAADLPTIIPTALFAAQDQASFAKRRKHLGRETAAGSDTSKYVEGLMADHYARVEQQEEINTRVSKARKEFIKKKQAPGSESKSAKQLGEHFDKELAPDIRSQHRRNIRGGYGGDAVDNKTPNKYENKLQWIIPGATLVSQMIKATVQENADKRDDHMNAWKMIKHLKVELEEEFAANARKDDHSFATRSADEVYINGVGTRHNEHISLTDYVIEVLQEHERDRLGIVSEEGKQPKKPLGPAMINKMMPTISMVTEELASGRLDPYALVALVGEHKLIKHKSNGAREFVEIGEVRQSLNELLGTMSNRAAVTSEEFFSNFADPALIETTLKENLENMHGNEKAFFAALFPDDILKQAGVEREAIIDLRKRAHDHMYEIVAAAVVHMAARDHDHLREMGLSDDDIDHVEALSQRIAEGDIKALHLAVDGRDKTIIDAVRNAGLHEQLNTGAEGKDFWANRVRESDKYTDLQNDTEEKKPSGRSRASRNSQQDMDAYDNSDPDFDDKNTKARNRITRQRSREQEQDTDFTRN